MTSEKKDQKDKDAGFEKPENDGDHIDVKGFSSSSKNTKNNFAQMDAQMRAMVERPTKTERKMTAIDIRNAAQNELGAMDPN